MYYVYQITNTLNDMIYVGVHKSTDPNDSYMGSGVHIKNAIKKYGIENFKKEILFEFDNAEDAYAKEAEIVNREFLSRNDVYNISFGGKGDKRGKKEKNKAIGEKISSSLKKYYAENGHNFKGRNMPEQTRKNISNGWSVEKKELQRQRMLARIAENPDCVKGMKGKKMSDESKEKMKEAAKKRWEKSRKVVATCPHCGKSGVEQSLKRWHFNNCRYKEKDIL